MVNTSTHLREELPPDIVKWANLESTINSLYDTFAAWREKNAELLDNFLNQPYFNGEESIINKLIEIKPNITFNEIGNEWINLASIWYNNKLTRELKYCLDETNDNIKRKFISEIFEKVRIGTWWPTPPYNTFVTDCPVPVPPLDTNVISYLQDVVNYLNSKENVAGGKKTVEILTAITITNNDLNSWLTPPLLPWRTLSTVPANTKNIFDNLLSFEIGKEADRTLKIVNDITDKLWWLFSNSFPAINTIISESPEYKYRESILGPDFEPRKQVINNDKNLTSLEKKKKINDLKRELYIKYLKTKSLKVWNALEVLYNNNFDYSKLDTNTLKDFIDKIVNIRINKLFDDWTNSVININYINMDEFAQFYKDLACVDSLNTASTTIRLTNVNTTSTRTDPYIDIPIHKQIVQWENPRLNDIEQYSWNSKSFDAIPLRYEINKSDIDNLDITLEDRTQLLKFLSRFKTDSNKYIIEWKDVWMLIYLFFVVNRNPRITTFDPDKQTAVEKVFWKVEPSEHTEKLNDTQQFKKDIEKMWTWVKFEDWVEIWMPMWDSELPWWWYQRMKIKISDIDENKWTFQWTVSWWELKFNDKLEWKSHTFDMNNETIKELKKISKDSSKIWLLPNPKTTDFNSHKNSLQNKLWTSSLDFPIKWTTWDWNKFIHRIVDAQGKEKDEKIEYFWTKDNKAVYKIEYNPIRNSFKVSSSFNWKEKWKNWKSEDRRFSYSRDMDRNNFLIFFTQKWLTPQTQEEAANIIDKNEQELRMLNAGHRKLNWFSINNIKNTFKTLKWNIKNKMDAYNKVQDEKLEEILVWDRWLYLKLDAILWFIPSVKEWLWELQQDYYNERGNRTWKKIDFYLKKFQADPDFWTTFDQLPPHAKIQWWQSLQQIVLNRVKNAQDKMWDPGVYQAAALLLANIEKGWSPYRWLASEENKGVWVKALLGKAHYEQFKRDKAKLIKARDNAENWGPWDKKWLNETLAACEMKYIINNIRWSYKWLIVWSYEERWIPWKNNTNYVDNPAKRLLSDQFADKLESAYKWRFDKDSVNKKYSKFSENNSFDEMENEFGKSGSTRYQTWEAALRRMIDLATTNDLRKRMEKHFLTYLLSGALDVNCDPWLKKQLYWWAKPMMFVPWLLVKEAWVAENIALLLNEATNWDFSKNVTKYFHRNRQLDGSIDFKWLQKEINGWLTDERMEQLDDYFSKLPTKDFSGYPESKRIILQKYQEAMSGSNRDEGDWWILENSKVVSNWLLSSVEVVQKRMNIAKWEFNGKDIDENNNMKDFRKNVTKDINKRTTDPREVAFVLDKFFNRFGIDSQQVYEWVITADYYNKNRWSFSLPYKGVELNMWNIWDKEIESILWYAFQWNAWKSRWLWCDRLPNELFEALEAFQIYFRKAFYSWDLLRAKDVFKPKAENTTPLLMGSREVYDLAFAWETEYQWMDSNATEEDLFSSDDSKKRKAKKNKIKELLRSTDFINSDIVNIEKQLKRNLGWTSGQFPTVTSSLSKTLREEYLKNQLAA